MVSNFNLCIERADNELYLARSIQLLSDNSKLKKEYFNLEDSMTFYSAVIAHAYYAIFYSAKAYLISKGINIPEQGQHQYVYYKFKKIIKTGELDKKLLNIYEDAKIKADSLLLIMEDEKEKRNTFTYKTLPQANKGPAEKSIENAQFFIVHIKAILAEK